MNDYGHRSVLLQEAIDGLDLQPGDIFLDGTLGNGGHAEEVVKRLGKKIRIIGLDIDNEAINRAKKRFESHEADATFVQGNFRHLDQILDEVRVNDVNKILLDIGVSSNQFEESGRGFSFQHNEPLQMTMKHNPGEEDLTAATIVNEWSEDSLEAIIRAYGEERFAKNIAIGIVEAREVKPISTTSELVDVIVNATPNWYHHRKIHPATKTFQALRITVNDELGALKDGLAKGFHRLASQGRIAVISFHSLEDRIVKNFFRDKHKEEVAELITKKPITPSRDEQKENRKARSAKLRILKKV
jgi:16S rRNA (cytosine1402-N4)-methyltransferase